MQFDASEQVMNFTDAEQELLDCARYEDIDLLPNIYFRAIDRREDTIQTIREATLPGNEHRNLRKTLLGECVVLSRVIVECKEVGREYFPEMFTVRE